MSSTALTRPRPSDPFPETAWVTLARRNELRVCVVGGVPRDQHADRLTVTAENRLLWLPCECRACREGEE